MKRISIFLIFAILLGTLAGCTADKAEPQIVATTLPVYEFTSMLCSGTDLTVGQLVTESVSCLHDYALQIRQMRMIASADTIVISGAGLEDFLEDALDSAHHVIDASRNTHVHSVESAHHEHNEHDGHEHLSDPHIWLSPKNAKTMAENICLGLSANYPDHKDAFERNLHTLLAELDALQTYGAATLSDLSCRKLITFHDGFAYFAESFDLDILRAVEEESGSEASAQELKELICLVDAYSLPAVFTEANGSVSAADVIAAETGASVYALRMAMSGDSYFDAMYHNIDTIKEALG